MQIARLYRAIASCTLEAEPPNQAFPGGAWERGGGADPFLKEVGDL
ncbi:hypothetical protein F7734_31600 [Scytonema sp. UIC 10036]|nr:hypothetical protein [Scytonema sp. UIC 10036]MUG96640.1 hypothetical protein [Scytonema sp. UIC 10036]